MMTSTTTYRMVAGREISTFGRRVRAPLEVLTRDPADVRHHLVETGGLVAHRWDNGADHGFWWEREFPSRAAAAAYVAALADAFGGRTIREDAAVRSGRPR